MRGAILSLDQLRAALQKGQGRAWLHVREHGGQGEVRQEVLHACLHNLTYDPQCEGSRVEWLLSLIDLTGVPHFYERRVLEALPEAKEFWDADQLVELAAAFARRGSDAARRALYGILRQRTFAESLGAEQLVDLDGLEGFLHVAEALGDRMLEDPDLWENDSLLCEVAERFGEEEVLRALRERAARSAGAEAYLEEVLEYRREREDEGLAERPATSLRDVLEDIDSPEEEAWYKLASFGQRCSEDERETVFARLLWETRRESLLRCLWVFGMRGVPHLDDRLLDLAQADDLDIQRAAISALGGLRHPGVRDLMLRLLASSPPVPPGALRLLGSNFAPGDGALVESVLRLPGDQGEIHARGLDLLHAADAVKDPELAGCLSWVYEETPCSLCRYSAVAALLDRGCGSAELFEECLHDCEEDTQSLAEEALKGDRP